jgi:hypothetical protein
MSDYFRDKIARGLDFIEGQARKVDDAYLTEVERLAAKTEDHVLADFIRTTVKPNRVLSEVRRIRNLLTRDVVAADQALDGLMWKFEFIEGRIRQPYFVAGIASSFGARKGGNADAMAKRSAMTRWSANICSAAPRHGWGADS